MKTVNQGIIALCLLCVCPLCANGFKRCCCRAAVAALFHLQIQPAAAAVHAATGGIHELAVDPNLRGRSIRPTGLRLTQKRAADLTALQPVDARSEHEHAASADGALERRAHLRGEAGPRRDISRMAKAHPADGVVKEGTGGPACAARG